MNKFKRGDGFKTIGELCDWIAGGGWVWWHNRPKHPAFMKSQQLFTLMVCLSSLYQAIPQDGENPPEPDPRQKTLFTNPTHIYE